ncbi:flagellar biosynthetic protein FliQ [Vannielia litorea]|uniref:flagellar biosynthetic protein FliQ n=1 Tax=Vannielia litorea TaxID=1217970 RepID=UPI001C942707|nr:flagellar biosynthetic protein FliQ [Vannielia litorea]MBY6154504.1 flagellar biosynthetic protein FliQ [Vannielia litorea]
MEAAGYYDTLREGLWVGVIIALPILIVALVAGVAIGLVQALTSVQEMTLTFVPKLAAILAVFWLTMGFMTESLVSFFQSTLVPLIAGG